MRARWQLVVIVAVALATPILATLLFLYSPPTGTTNRGELLEPTPLAAELWPNDDRWQLAVVAGASCDERCRQNLCAIAQARQVNLGEIERIGRLWLVADAGTLPKAIEYGPGCGRDLAAARRELAPIDVLADVTARRASAPQLATLPPPATGLAHADYIYLIDPAGLVMMRFARDAPVADIAKDLKRLLRLSRRVG